MGFAAAAALLIGLIIGWLVWSQRQAAAGASAAVAPAAAARGLVQIDVSPWAQVEVDGVVAGVTPPLTQLALPVGRHTVTLRHAELAPYNAVIDVAQGMPVRVAHEFEP